MTANSNELALFWNDLAPEEQDHATIIKLKRGGFLIVVKGIKCHYTDDDLTGIRQCYQSQVEKCQSEQLDSSGHAELFRDVQSILSAYGVTSSTQVTDEDSWLPYDKDFAQTIDDLNRYKKGG